MDITNPDPLSLTVDVIVVIGGEDFKSARIL
jgi:hypothetical protein